MKKMYVIPLMDADHRFASYMKKELMTSAGVDVNPDFFEVKDLNRGISFEVPDEKEMDVVNAIYQMGDMEVFKHISFDDESGNHIVESYFDE